MINQTIAEKYGNNLVNISEELLSVKPELGMHEKFTKILIQHKFVFGEDYKHKITSYFRAIFKNISCNSKLIYPKVNYNNPGITIGKYGIGIKYGSKADVVVNYDDIMLLIERHKDKVIEGLNNHRKWGKAEEFEKFVKIISLSELIKDLSIPLKKPVSIIDRLGEYNKYSFIKIPIVSLKFHTIHSESEGLNISCIRADKDNDIYLEKMNIYKYPENTLNHFLFEDQIKYLCDTFEKIIIQHAKNQNLIFKKLNREFGKYIMASKL